MDTVPDFEDMLALLEKHEAKYLIIGGMAFIYHAKPRYTKDMDLWIGPSDENIQRANRALVDFGSPTMLAANEPTQILQADLASNRVDLHVDVGSLSFDDAWARRIHGRYGPSRAFWIDLDSLIEIKSRIDHPKHQEDARVLREVKQLRALRLEHPPR